MNIAIEFHDFIYEPGVIDNEKLSVEIACIKHPDHSCFLTKAIMAAGSHNKADSHEINLFLDADMCIIGEDEFVYGKYRSELRKEYSMYSDEEWKAGRLKFLKSWHGFTTDEFNADYGKQAIINITNEINDLC